VKRADGSFKQKAKNKGFLTGWSLVMEKIPKISTLVEETRKGESRKIQELERERKALINWDAVDDELSKNDEDTGE
jgi:hypothetical protein